MDGWMDLKQHNLIGPWNLFSVGLELEFYPLKVP